MSSTYDLRVVIDGTEVTDVINIVIRRGADFKNSKAYITLKNANQKHVNTGSTEFIQFDDLKIDSSVELYCAFQTIPEIKDMTSDEKLEYLLFNGFITKMDLINTNKKATIKLTCTDAMLLLMNKVKIANYGSGNTSSTIVENLVQKALGISFTNYDVETTTNSVIYAAKYKSIHEHIASVSSPTQTGFSRNAVFKLVPDPAYSSTKPYKFIWRDPKDSASTTLNGSINSSVTTIVVTSSTDFPSEGVVLIGNELIKYSSLSGNTLTVAEKGRGYFGTTAISHTTGTAVEQQISIIVGKTGAGINKAYYVKGKISEESAVNMLIMRLGKDLIGRSITWYAYDLQASTAKIRMKIMDWRWASEDYIDREVGDAKTELTSDFAPGSYPATILVGDTSAFASSGHIQVIINDNPEIIAYSSKTATTLTVALATDRSQLNTVLIPQLQSGTIVKDISALVVAGNTAVRSGIKNYSRDVPAEKWFRLQDSRWNFDVQIDGANIEPLDIVFLTATDIGVNTFPLRIKDITHNITPQHWTTTLKLEEDELKR